MRRSDIRRRWRSAVAAHDWLELATTVLGAVFLAIAAACALGIAVSIATLGDPDPGFETTPGFLQATRGLGIVVFAVLGLVATGVGWFLAGDAVRSGFRRLRARR